MASRQVLRLDYRRDWRLNARGRQWQAHDYKFVRQGSRGFPDGLASAMRRSRGWHREDDSSSAYEREWARDPSRRYFLAEGR